jgi:hypothetical protein
VAVAAVGCAVSVDDVGDADAGDAGVGEDAEDADDFVDAMDAEDDVDAEDVVALGVDVESGDVASAPAFVVGEADMDYLEKTDDGAGAEE